MSTKQKQQYNNNKPPYLDKTWQYNQFNSIADRFKAMGWIPPSEGKSTK
jgi:hypothetical protein